MWLGAERVDDDDMETLSQPTVKAIQAAVDLWQQKLQMGEGGWGIGLVVGDDDDDDDDDMETSSQLTIKSTQPAVDPREQEL